MTPFCDYVGATVSAEDWSGLRLAISPILDSIGMAVKVDGPDKVLWRAPDSTGTVKAERRCRVWVVGASGAVCAGLRAVGRFDSYLAAIGTFPHRVTRVDATLDIPVDAAPIVAEITRAGRAGEFALTRKAIRPGDVTGWSGVRADGVVTGTVYVGPKRSDARMAVYDKQHERACHKLPDLGPMTRYELRLRAQSGVTLRDASLPAAAFYHFASPGFVPAPAGVPAWVPHGSGYVLAAIVPLSPPERLARRVSTSVDLASLIVLAKSCGPYGMELLISQIRRLGESGVGAAHGKRSGSSCRAA